ncbi:GNAT family N-acetyltransferase [Glaciihabitans sp. dw_435]|uniref:GNAT family N-acetyltransferase n=1 Tax=Glaciihabitans sp. dw_435 TaxID=2720081 RepID=UPI001BD2DD69|nr:GNAT family protein [Glaciihabitans sp. dw_435]
MHHLFDLGDGFWLGLRTLETVPEMLALTEKNIARLRRWEPWAQEDPTLAGTRLYTQLQLDQYARGTAVPAVLYDGEVAVGSVSMRLDRANGSAELGYWIDAGFEGQGLVTRACTALIGHAAAEGMSRVEIRAATGNVRSRRVAERLGFTHERVLPAAFPVGNVRLDVAVYALALPPSE